MIDLSKARWILSNEESYTATWLQEHGYSATVEQISEHEAVFHVTKDNRTKNLKIKSPKQENDSLKLIMETFDKTF